MPVSGIPITPPHYGTRAGIEALYGATNADTWADINAAGLTSQDVDNRINDALTIADDWINARAAEYPTDVPTQASAFYPRLSYVANLYAGVWLYRGRGEPAENAKMAGVMQANKDEAESELDRILAHGFYTGDPTAQTGPSSDPVTYFPSARAVLWWPAFPYYP